MTFEQYRAKCLALSLEYVASEQERITKAEAAWGAYKAAMKALGLHPLTPDEILARKRELRQMEADAHERYSDNESMRALYNLQVVNA